METCRKKVHSAQGYSVTYDIVCLVKLPNASEGEIYIKMSLKIKKYIPAVMQILQLLPSVPPPHTGWAQPLPLSPASAPGVPPEEIP